MSNIIWVLLLSVASPAIAQYGEQEQPPSQENPCNLADCRPNTRCIVVNGEAQCVPINENGGGEQENPCNLVDCIPNTRCIVVSGEAQCVPINGHGGKSCGTPKSPKPHNPTCATVLCIPPTTCVLRPKNSKCRTNCPIEAVCVAPIGNDASVTPTSTSSPIEQKCPANEQFNSCGSACEPSCKNPIPQICTLQCIVGCQCKPGFFRNEQKACVANCNGGASGDCGPNEERKQCGTACEPTCTNPNPVCTKQCINNVCQCKQAYIRDATGKCIPVGQCPKDRIKPCSEMNCPNGTVCEQGREICPFVPPCFTQQTKCVPRGPPRQTCATKKCPPDTVCEQEIVLCIRAPCPQAPPKCVKREPSLTCANVRCRAGTVCKLVDVVCKKAPCSPRPECVADEEYNPCAATTCPVGSECRLKQVQCVRAPCDPIAECYTPPQSQQCGQFETFKDCASHCEPSCTNKSPICILSCAPPKCQCNQGFFRNSSGACVTEAECDGSNGNTNSNPYARLR